MRGAEKDPGNIVHALLALFPEPKDDDEEIRFTSTCIFLAKGLVTLDSILKALTKDTTSGG